MTEAASLRIEGVTKRFASVSALDGVEIFVPGGAFAALLGPSGCGKTTLLRIIAGFERADAGTVTIGGTVVAAPAVHAPPERRRVGVVPQEAALFPHLDVRENVAFGLPRRERRGPRVDELLEAVGLAGLGARRPHQLSGGQQQRVALARCLAPEPTVVLLDEPFAALDASLRGEIRDETRRVLRASGATAVLVTHDQEEALSLADLVVLLRDGRVVQSGDPVALYHHPADTWAARFVGDANVLPATLDEGGARCVLGTIGVRDDRSGGSRDVQVLLRPEQLRLVAKGTVERGAVRAVVVSHAFFGAQSLVRVRLDSGEELLVRLVAEVPPVPGQELNVEVHGEAVAYAAP